MATPGVARTSPDSLRGPVNFRLLSVIVPAYNEAKTIRAILEKILSLPDIDLDVIVVDDGSTDDTGVIAEEVAGCDLRVRVIRHEQNQGKGAAIRTALEHIQGDIVVIQDADLEYDPRDWLRMLSLFEDPETTVVYGSRRLNGRSPSAHWTYYLGGVFLSWLSNLLYGSRITDEPTCYKMLRTSVLRKVDLRANGFEFCPEVTAKILRAGHRIKEVPITYSPRDRAHGKKVSCWDGVMAAWTLIWCRVRR